MLTATDERIGATIEHDYLDKAEQYLLDGEVERGIHLIAECLHRIRSVLSRAEWNDYIKDVCLVHPVATLIYEDPFTRRAYRKPRGYPGDAVTIDYVYGLCDDRLMDRHVSPLGQAIYRYAFARPALVAVRERRRIVADLIDILASRIEKPRILSLAAGHLREAALSSALRCGRIRELVALDQDARSLAVIEKDYSGYGVTPICSDVRAVLTNSQDLGSFDFVYATGLFDYLRPRMAVQLVKRMLAMTRPGGQVLVPNFTPETPDAGYMEAFMGWHLIYRSESELRALFIDEDFECQDLFMGANRNIAYMVVQKA